MISLLAAALHDFAFGHGSVAFHREISPKICLADHLQVLAKRNHFEVSCVGDTEENHPSKRRRLGQKSAPLEIILRNPHVSWSDVLHAGNAVAPRVGVRVVEEGLLKNAVQRLCPNHDVQHLVLCRGTDRMLGPNKSLSPGSAPFRKMACIRRRFEDVVVEDE